MDECEGSDFIALFFIPYIRLKWGIYAGGLFCGIISLMDDEIKNEKDVFAELAKVRTAPKPLRIDTDEPRHDRARLYADVADEPEGQLTIDVFQDDDNIFVQSAVAGINPDDLEINITKESVTIRGKRERTQRVSEKSFFYQECFWGRFSRSVVLPQEIDSEKSTASIKNGILTIKMPKLDRRRGKSVRVRDDD